MPQPPRLTYGDRTPWSYILDAWNSLPLPLREAIRQEARARGVQLFRHIRDEAQRILEYSSSHTTPSGQVFSAPSRTIGGVTSQSVNNIQSSLGYVRPQNLLERFNMEIDEPLKGTPGAATLTYYGQRKKVCGRNKSRMQQLLADVAVRRSQYISRFQGLTANWNLGLGCYTLAVSTKTSAVIGTAPNQFRSSTTFLPMYAYNLTALPSGVAATVSNGTTAGVDEVGLAFPVRMYQLCKVKWTNQNGVQQGSTFYMWNPVSGRFNSGNAGINSTDAQQYCDQPEDYDTLSDTQRRYIHHWSDIKLLAYGATAAPVDFNMSIVNFKDPNCAPSRLFVRNSQLAPGTGFAGPAGGAALPVPNQGLYFNYDTEDTLTNMPLPLSQNPSGGLLPSLSSPGGNTIFPVLDNELSSAMIFWEEYWSQRLAHPLVYTNPKVPHESRWTVKEHVSFHLQEIPNLEAVPNAPVRLFQQDLFYHADQSVNTVDARLQYKTDQNDIIDAGSTIPIGTGYANRIPIVNPAELPVRSVGIYQNDPSKDDWLIISSMYNTPVLADSTQDPVFMGGAITGNSTGFNNTWAGSFDISVRSKFSTAQ